MSTLKIRVYQIVDALNMRMVLGADGNVTGEQNFKIRGLDTSFQMRVIKTLDFGPHSTTLVLRLSVKESGGVTPLRLVVDSSKTKGKEEMTMTLMSIKKLAEEFKWSNYKTSAELFSTISPAVLASYWLEGEKWEEAA